MAAKWNRRAFIAALGAGVTTVVNGCGPEREPVLKMAGTDTVTARRSAVRRFRRMIMNNDGNDIRNTPPEIVKTPEYFLSRRTSPLVGSHVDSIFYCTGVFNHYTHRSDETELLLGNDEQTWYARDLIDQGADTLEIMTSFCHQHDIEIFWSMRMNDHHDSYTPYLLPQWKKDHPDLLMGRPDDKFPYVEGKWSMVDYAHKEVRDKVFRIMEDVASRYDVDGIEYDFFRHPAYFKQQMLGEPVTQAQCDMMTELLARIRAMTDGIAARRGRPMLIAVRMPDAPDFAKAIGLDIETWLNRDLVDIVTGGGYFKLRPWSSLAQLGRKYGVPVYACFVSRRIMSGGEPEADSALSRWRGEALNAWNQGVNGIYTFNRFNPHDPLFRELGDPKLLESLPRIDQESYIGDSGYLDPGYWLKDGRSYVRKKA